MQENTNRALLTNTVVLYARLGVTLLCSLLTTRYALAALGVTDFGLYTLVGSIIVFANVINATMLSTCNRFIATAIGKGDEEEVRRTLSVNVIVQGGLSLLTLLVMMPLGVWYILHHVNYAGDLHAAAGVFVISFLGVTVQSLGVPYNGLLVARERFWVFCLAEVVMAVAKLLLTWWLVGSLVADKLHAYTLIVAVTTALPSLCYYLYCRRAFPYVSRLMLVRDRVPYIRLFCFSGWVSYGAVVQLGQAQITSLLINAFFTTVMNAALGVANYLKSGITLFTENVTRPIGPQITKSYVSGDGTRCQSLMVWSSKLAFMTTYLICAPFLAETHYLLGLWLGEVPPMAVMFTRLLLIDILVQTFNRGISEYIFADGRIGHYQFWVNTLLLLSLAGCYAVLALGYPAWSMLLVCILFSVLSTLARQVILHWQFGFPNGILIRRAYLPSLVLLSLSLPSFYPLDIHPLLHIALLLLYIGLLILYIGMTSAQRRTMYRMIRRR